VLLFCTFIRVFRQTTECEAAIAHQCVCVCVCVCAACSYDSSLSLASQNSAGPTSNLLTTTDISARPHAAAAAVEYNGLEFRITMDSRSGPPVTITLVASTLQEKAAWCSDISQVSSIVVLFSPYFT